MIPPAVFKALLVAAVVAALAFCWNWFLDYERDIGYQARVAEDAVQLNADLRAARAETERLFRLKDQAEIKGAEREKTIQRQLSSARSERDRLRDDLNDANGRLSNATIEACRHYAVALSDAFGECAERYYTVAADDSQCESDVEQLKEAP